MAPPGPRPQIRAHLFAVVALAALLWLAAPAGASDFAEPGVLQAQMAELDGGVAAESDPGVPGDTDGVVPAPSTREVPESPAVHEPAPAQDPPVAEQVGLVVEQEPVETETVPAPAAREERPSTTPPPPRVTQNVNLDIRVLSPGDDGAVTQELVLPGGGDGATGGGPGADSLPGLDWNWNWTWSEDCGAGASGASGSDSGWNWNWNWCGGVSLPGLAEPGAEQPALPFGVDTGQAPAVVAPMPGTADSAAHVEGRSPGPRDASEALGSISDTHFAGGSPAAAAGALLHPSGGRSTAAWQPATGASPSRRTPDPRGDPGAPIVAATGANAGAAGGAGSALPLALLAALLLLGPSLSRGLLPGTSRRVTSLPNSRLERPG
jgi:hypothetical protein